MQQLQSGIAAEKRRVLALDDLLLESARRLNILGGINLSHADVSEMVSIAKAVEQMGGVNSIAVKLAARKRKRAETARTRKEEVEEAPCGSTSARRLVARSGEKTRRPAARAAGGNWWSGGCGDS